MKNQHGTMKNHGNQPKTMKNHETTLKNHGNQPKTMKNPETTSAGSQLTWEGGQGRNKQKCYERGVTTDLLDV